MIAPTPSRFVSQAMTWDPDAASSAFTPLQNNTPPPTPPAASPRFASRNGSFAGGVAAGGAYVPGAPLGSCLHLPRQCCCLLVAAPSTLCCWQLPASKTRVPVPRSLSTGLPMAWQQSLCAVCVPNCPCALDSVYPAPLSMCAHDAYHMPGHYHN